MGSLDDFLAMPNTKHFMIALFLSAIMASMFVIPLNALAQQRAEPKHRARLLAAGALLLNAATTLSQLMVMGLGLMAIAPHYTFAILGVVTTLIMLYVFYRAGILKKEAI